MNHRHLHDIAKFAAGLVAADLLSLIWFAQTGLFPIHLFGIKFTSAVVAPGIIFDIALLIVLIHYGWHLGKIPRMRERTYLLVAGALFTIVAAAHILRLFAGTSVRVAGWSVPLWLSWIGVAVTVYLAYSSFIFATRTHRR